MLALCGQPYEVDAIAAYFNSVPLLSFFTPAQLGMQAWSVVDVVIEADPVPRIAVPLDHRGTAKYSDIANHVAYSFSVGELRDVKLLSLPLSGCWCGE